MPLPKKRIPRDKPEVIRARQRLDPTDFSVVLAKNNDGEVVEVWSGGRMWLWPDGVKRPYAKWPRHPNHQPVPDDVAKKMKNGVAEMWAFKWGGKHQMTQAKNHSQGWRAVSKKEALIHCPYVFGEEVDDRVHHVDLFLMQRPRWMDDEAVTDKAASQDIDRYLNQRKEESAYALQEAGEGKVATVTQSFEPVEADAFTVSPDTGLGDQ